jgi:hypothetical protein
MHTNNSGYGVGAVLNMHKEARGFLSECDEAEHRTWIPLKLS